MKKHQNSAQLSLFALEQKVEQSAIMTYDGQKSRFYSDKIIGIDYRWKGAEMYLRDMISDEEPSIILWGRNDHIVLAQSGRSYEPAVAKQAWVDRISAESILTKANYFFSRIVEDEHRSGKIWQKNG